MWLAAMDRGPRLVLDGQGRQGFGRARTVATVAAIEVANEVIVDQLPSSYFYVRRGRMELECESEPAMELHHRSRAGRGNEAERAP